MLKSRIKIRLAELEIKQQELSDKLGVTKQTMSLWVNGKSMPTLETAFKIAKLLDCKLDELYVYKENE
jgi:DNA-binding XRE family transcriptional regulator